MSEVTRRCSVKKVFLEISQNSQENNCARVFFNKCRHETCNFIEKETLAQVEISAKFLRTPFLYNTPVTASAMC